MSKAELVKGKIKKILSRVRFVKVHYRTVIEDKISMNESKHYYLG